MTGSEFESVEGRLRYLQGLNQLSRVLSQDLEIETVLQGVVEELVTLFECDLALLGYPGHPEADSFTMPFQAARVPYGPLTREPVPLIPSAREAIRHALETSEPSVYGRDHQFVKECAISGYQHPQSMVMVMVRPRIGLPWCFEMHQCSHERVWQPHELRLFRDIGLRVGDVLSNMLLHREQRRTAEALASTNTRLEASLRQLMDTQQALRESEDRLRHAQKMEALGRLAGGVAHDFNNLLTVIGGYGSLAADIAARQGHEPLQEHLGEIRKAADRAQSLTSQLLAFSRRQTLTPTLVHLNTVVAEMHQLLSRLLGDDVQVRLRLDPSIDRVKVDRGQMEQVILNLAVNARDAMPNGGVWEIGTSMRQRDTDRVVVLSVRDTGVGMTSEVKSRIFEPFFTTKEVGKGTGLGLASVFGIVNQSGGTISVDSEPGCGATFTILLPVARGQTLVRMDADPTVFGNLGGRERVLVVEDDASVRTLIRQILESEGYDVVCASDGLDALAVEAAMTGRLDLLITDVLMPRLGGPELAERLLESRPDLRVLFVSAHAGTRRPAVGERTDLLDKPFGPAQLLARVRTLLDRALRSDDVASAG